MTGPQTWTPRPIKRVLDGNDAGAWGDDPTGAEDVMVLRSSDIRLDGSWDLSCPAARHLEARVARATRLRENDIVVVKSSGSAAHLGKAAIVTADVASRRPSFSNFVQRLRPSTEANSRYLWHLLNSDFAAEQVARLGTTTTGLRNLSGTLIGEIPFPGPPPDEQREIADFLDVETARIDALIAKKRRMIKLSRERRQAAIDAALGSGQERRKLRRLIGRLTSGPRGWANYAANNGVLFLRITNVARDDIELKLRDTVFVDPPAGAERTRTQVREGDVLVSITADIGSVGVVRAEHGGAAVSQHLALMTPVACSGDWLAFALSTSMVRAQLDAGQYGGTKTQLSLEEIRRVEIPMVDRHAEAAVIETLTQRLSDLMRLSQKLDRQIELLIERRQALITAAVTGQIPVSV